MTKLIAPFFILLFFLSSCATSDKNENRLLHPEALPSQKLTIDNSRDTVIKTSNGAFLDIKKGSFSQDKVELEIKEAYTMEQMIRGGLTTTTDGQPLSSGGMIHINASGNVNITKAIRVSIPTTFVDERMELYKGAKEGNKINWIEPAPLPPNPVLTTLDTGSMLFRTNCMSCHNLKAAPGLLWPTLKTEVHGKTGKQFTDSLRIRVLSFLQRLIPVVSRQNSEQL